jgi:phage/plasmid-like protein (TIGR03299 family)|tara:strand:- start:19466 stop:20416 length:951 start_codon:yes stop_codon:yes gene_type:complete
MSHEVETMAYADALPWHGLGVKVHNDLSPQQMMQKAGVDWKVHEVESFVEFNGTKMPTGQKSLIRETDGKILTNVGENWHPCQNETAFEFFQDYVAAGDMEMHTAGSLKGGQYVWALAKVKESFDLFGGDQVDSYMLFSNPHVYGKSIDVRFTPIRVVCNNTLTFALNGEVNRAVKINHKSEFNTDMVKDQLGIAHEKFAKYKEMAEFLGSRPFSVENMLNYYNEVFPLTSGSNEDEVVYETLSGQAKNCVDNLQTQPGAEYAEGSWWQVFNAATYVTDHIHGRNADNRLHSQWYGQNQLRKIKAAEKAVEYANAA